MAVFGLGAVGLAAIQAAKVRKAGRIFAIDMNKAKFEIAVLLGATDCINPLELPEGIKPCPWVDRIAGQRLVLGDAQKMQLASL